MRDGNGVQEGKAADFNVQKLTMEMRLQIYGLKLNIFQIWKKIPLNWFISHQKQVKRMLHL